MNRETIEKLAIDSAAGELSDDARLLFESYLAEHPEAKRWALDITGIYEMTRAAIEAKTEAAPPIVQRRCSPPVNWLAAARWAAVLAIAVFAGFSAGRWNQPAKTSRTEFFRVAEQPRTIATVTDIKEKYAATFWGRKVLASIEPKPPLHTAARNSTGSFWDTYKRRLKEKTYE